MARRHVQIWVLLVFCQKMTSGADPTTVTDGASHDIYCKPTEMGSMVVWFRLLDKSGMEFIASFSNAGTKKSSLHPSFNDAKMNENILTVKAFSAARDSGVYSCATIKNNELKFGDATQLLGVTATVTVPAMRPPQGASTQPCPSTTREPCTCTNSGVRHDNSFLHCPPVILGPLAGACGLLLLLLIVTALYCNKIRTRRCPHHYKRRPRTTAPRKQMMTDRHV